jgi:hypothetical protein
MRDMKSAILDFAKHFLRRQKGWQEFRDVASL